MRVDDSFVVIEISRPRVARGWKRESWPKWLSFNDASGNPNGACAQFELVIHSIHRHYLLPNLTVLHYLNAGICVFVQQYKRMFELPSPDIQVMLGMSLGTNAVVLSLSYAQRFVNWVNELGQLVAT